MLEKPKEDTRKRTDCWNVRESGGESKTYLHCITPEVQRNNQIRFQVQRLFYFLPRFLRDFKTSLQYTLYTFACSIGSLSLCLLFSPLKRIARLTGTSPRAPSCWAWSFVGRLAACWIVCFPNFS